MGVTFWVGRDGEDMTFRLERQAKLEGASLADSPAR